MSFIITKKTHSLLIVENVVTDFILTEKLLMFTYLAKYIAEF